MTHLTVTMQDCVCWVCGTPFSVAQTLYANKKEKDKTLFCPNGCKLGLGESQAAKLRRQLDRANARVQHATDQLQASERSNRALRGVVTKKTKQLSRTKHGVCPCCNRHFDNLRRHMETKHPEFEG